MATRSQRRKEKQKQKRKQKIKAKKDQQRKGSEQLFRPIMPPAVDSPHMRRIAQQKPQAWPDELREDVAVFEDTVLESLPAELAEQVMAVRKALSLACDSRGEEALQTVAGIVRTSPLSEWRIFLRGLVAWLAEDLDAAQEAWKRLDFQRRPGRMAVAMVNAHRSDLSDASDAPRHSGAQQAKVDVWSEVLDDQLRYHAKLLRRTRIERTAIRIAEAGVCVREEMKPLLVGSSKIRWLKQFVDEHRSLEPSLTAALQLVALERAAGQPFIDVFELACKLLEGPKHDRRNLLRAYYYYERFDDSDAGPRRERALKEYLERDLPNNQELPEALRGAIASQIHLAEARVELQPPDIGPFFFFTPEVDSEAIRFHFNASIKAYPANRAAYKAYSDWLADQLDNDRLTKARRTPFLEEQASVMTRWSQALPDDAQPRLWLVDYLLEQEQTEAAKPHVDWLAASRQDDPRVRAAPWKWQLLEAMRLCRRKAWFAMVPSRLDEAEKLWPVWLSRQWLPYLRAGFALRSGDEESFELQRQEIVQRSGLGRDSLSDACMMLAAAQSMRVPSGRLKELRAPVDTAVKNLGKVPDEELFAAAGFFWDLHRTQLLYPAFRMHGPKFVKEMFGRLKRTRQPEGDRLNDASIHAAIFLSAEYRCLHDGYRLTLPRWYSNPAVMQHPMYVAAKVNALLKLRFPSRMDEHAELRTQLRDAAQSERNPFYRHWFTTLADEMQASIAQWSQGFGFNFNPLDFMFDEDDDDEDGLGFDPDCNCPACRAARQEFEATKR